VLQAVIEFLDPSKVQPNRLIINLRRAPSSASKPQGAPLGGLYCAHDDDIFLGGRHEKVKKTYKCGHTRSASSREKRKFDLGSAM
jgi:hypothetical protein